MLYLRCSGCCSGLGHRFAVLVAAVALLLQGCESRVPDGSTAQLGRGVEQGGVSTDLVPAGPTRFTAATGYRVSPAPSPSGRWLAVAGLRGQGLYLLPTDGGRERVVDADFRGPWRWRNDGARDVLCFGSGTTADALDAETWEARSPCAPVAHHEEWGDQIHKVGGRTFYHNSRVGTVTVVHDQGVERFPLDRSAWGAKVSPDGRYVAYCTGNLAKAELILLDVAAGRTQRLGTGAHPAWFPDSARLVYTAISRIERLGRSAMVTAATLRLYEVATGKSRVLAPTSGQTVQRAEVQPAVSPDGRNIVYADWRSGAIYRMSAPRKVAP